MVETNTIEDLANRLEHHSAVDYLVVNRTGLTGNFHVYINGASLLTCAPKDRCLNEDPTGQPSLFTAFQKLGLKLEQRREKIEYLVVDGGDRVPTEN
jgi:uncharacterized protein (TIGR03435 family)